jgi:hypothetical protein
MYGSSDKASRRLGQATSARSNAEKGVALGDQAGSRLNASIEDVAIWARTAVDDLLTIVNELYTQHAGLPPALEQPTETIMFRPNTTIGYEALFASDLQPSQQLEPQQIRAAILHTIRTLGVRDCAARVAQEFGDHPDTAVLRMRWAKKLVSQAYADGPRTLPPCAGTRPTACVTA